MDADKSVTDRAKRAQFRRTLRSMSKAEPSTRNRLKEENEDIDADKISIERSDKAQFRKKTQSRPKLGRSTRKHLNGGKAQFRKKTQSIPILGRSTRKYLFGGKAQFRKKTQSRPKLGRSTRKYLNGGTDNEDLNPHKFYVKRMIEAELRKYFDSINKKLSSACLCGSSSRQDACRGPNKILPDNSSSFAEEGNDSDDSEDTVIEIISEVKVGGKSRNVSCADRCFVIKDADLGSDREGPNKSSSYVHLGNDDEDTDAEDDDTERIDESEFRNKKVNEGCSAATSGEIFVDAFLRDSEISSYGPGVEKNFGGVTRSQSKTATIKKHQEVDKVSLDLSDESSSSTISGFDSFEDDDFEVDNSCIKGRKKAVSPTHSKDKDGGHSDDHVHQKSDASSSDIHDVDETYKVSEANETENQNKRKRGSFEHYDLCRKLADSVLGRGPMLEKDENNAESKQTPTNQNQISLPLKFRFEDEVPTQVDKTDFEKEVEGWFAESEDYWAIEKTADFNYSEVDKKCENSPVGETQDARCARGKHELVVRDDAGLICVYCLHEELGPKDIMPEWAEKICQDSWRNRSSMIEELSRLDELHLASSMNKYAVFNSNCGTVWDIKPGVRESMYTHQLEGFEFLWMNLAGSINLVDLKSSDPTEVGGCIISHAPGTGKTRLTIVFIETYLKLFPNCRPMVIVPASMLLTWEEEFKKWNIDFPFHNLNNLEFLDKENRLLANAKGLNKDYIRMQKIYSWNKGGSILGISYSLFVNLTGEKYINDKKNKNKNKKRRVVIDEKIGDLRKILLEKPGLVVLDEGHTPRNQRSNNWNVLLKLQTSKRVILSGTPFQNNFRELFNTLHLVRPAIAQEKRFASINRSRGFPSSRKPNANSASIPDSMVEKLKGAMSPFVHVHKGTILQESLPGLRDCVILLKPPPLQKSLIETLEGCQNTFKLEFKVALISVHPYLLKYCESKEKHRLGLELDVVEASKLNPNEGVKTKFILELVRLSVAMNEKVLVFSQFCEPLKLIKEQLKEVFKWIDGKQILQIERKTAQKQRQILINTFNDPLSEAKVMLASTKCCSEGISLVGASRVVLLDVVWNPSVERQAICRAYRIGQKKFVYTYHLMTSGTTEGEKFCRQAEKERLSELVFCSSSNESKERHTAIIEDRILEEMISHVKLKDMFEKIINQPKNTDLIQTFGLTS